MRTRLLCLFFVAVLGTCLASSCATSAQDYEVPHPIVEPGPFHGCAVEGDSQVARVRTLNRLKNRAVVPAKVSATVTLGTLFDPGDDTARFTNNVGGRVRGLVTDVKPGGIETVNCHAREVQWRDTHIEVVADAAQADTPVIVEVTPRWREAMRTIGVDWSTATLKALIGHEVEFTGWFFFDAEHVPNATHTNPRGTHLWRATVWELHPVTAIRVIE